MRIIDWTNSEKKYFKNNTEEHHNNHSIIPKYSFTVLLFVIGLVAVSAIKNKTRNLQQEISKLEASTNVTKFSLNQAKLDNEVITSPENISILAKEYLSDDFLHYKRSQIVQLNHESQALVKINKENINISSKNNLKNAVLKKVELSKTEIEKLKNMYNNPSQIPRQIKTKATNKINEKKEQIKNVYSSPRDTILSKRTQRWALLQIVKLFLGMPVIPGR
jgi:hypothetical protein